LTGVGIKNKRSLNSWDMFSIPKFFTKATLIYSDPIYIEKALAYEETSKVIDDCEIKMNELQEEAENSFKV
jgi:lysophospholipid acyltransferase (LPLAT)-like uncharacterized protein